MSEIRVVDTTIRDAVFGTSIHGKLLAYDLVLGVSALLFLVMLRIVNSRFGRVLEAIRERTTFGRRRSAIARCTTAS